jgi:hypothetical protein
MSLLRSSRKAAFKSHNKVIPGTSQPHLISAEVTSPYSYVTSDSLDRKAPGLNLVTCLIFYVRLFHDFTQSAPMSKNHGRNRPFC